jgi:superfamily I DNA/RNA helicase
MEVLPPQEAQREELHTVVPGAAHVGILESGTPRAEAVVVGKTIESLMGGLDLHAIDQKRISPTNADEDTIGELSFADFAVLFRTTEQSRLFCEVFDAAGIPWRLAGRKQVLDHPALVCLVAIFKMVENRGGLWDLIHSAPLLKPRLTTSTLDILKNWSFERRFGFDETLANAQRFPIPALGHRRQRELHLWIETLKRVQKEVTGKSLVEKLEYLYRELGLQDDIETDDDAREGYRHLVRWAAGAGDSISKFITPLALNQDSDLLSQPAEKVNLLTMHAAKGLEFPVVFVAGCEDGWIPLRRDDAGEWDEGEERRLLYVALTRARHRLYLSWARQRTLFGQKSNRQLSPFLKGIDPRILLHEALKSRRTPKHRQLDLF